MMWTLCYMTSSLLISRLQAPLTLWFVWEILTPESCIPISSRDILRPESCIPRLVPQVRGTMCGYCFSFPNHHHHNR